MIRFTTTARAALLMTVASGFIALTPPAIAADDDDVPQAELNVARTDFTSAHSVGQLKSRVRRTAYAICTANNDARMLMSADQRKCYNTALENGLAQVDSKTMEARRRTSTDVAELAPQEHLTH